MRNILFIHSSAGMGGIETFFMRFSKDLLANNIKAKFLFLYKSLTNENIERELKSVADVYYWDDICSRPLFKSDKLNLLLPINRKKIKHFFSSIECIHVDTALTCLCAKRIISCIKNPLKIVFGVYHINELSWNFNGKIPFYEYVFRKKIFKEKLLIIFFNEASSTFTKEKNNVSELNEMLFPIGIDVPIKKKIAEPGESGDLIKLLSIGRLVEFKKYNRYMIDLVKKLIDSNINVVYDVYGDGPLKDELIEAANEKQLSSFIQYKGSIDYSDIDKTLVEYDLFIGSGTSLLQAAANGVSSIIAIENESLPVTYGFFSSIPGIDYHEQRLPYPKIDIAQLILDFNSMPKAERKLLSIAHLKKVEAFGMPECTKNFRIAFNKAPSIDGDVVAFYIYLFGFLISETIGLCFNRPRYSQKYDQLI